MKYQTKPVKRIVVDAVPHPDTFNHVLTMPDGSAAIMGNEDFHKTYEPVVRAPREKKAATASKSTTLPNTGKQSGAK